MKNFFKKIGGYLGIYAVGVAMPMMLVFAPLMGCSTVRPPATPLTPEQRTDRLALVLKNMVADVVILATTDRNPEARVKIEKARDALNFLVASTNTSPRDIVMAITPLLQDAKPEVRVAANTVIGVLEAYWGDYVIDVSGGNENALKFLRALVEGLDAGLAMSK